MRLVPKHTGWFGNGDRVRAALLSLAVVVVILLVGWGTFLSGQKTGNARPEVLIVALVAAGVA